MKRVELLIEEARELSQNENYDSDSGISQRLFTRFFKNAQDAMQKGMTNPKTKMLLKTENTLTPVVNGQAFYSYPYDLFLNNVDTIEWSQNGTDSWIPLDKSITKERITSSSTGYPFSYIIKDTGIILNPPLQSGYLRWNYIKKLPTIERRAGRISAVTVIGGQVTSLTLDVNEASFDPTYINKQNILCVVDRAGDQVARNIPYTSVNPTTGVVTLEAPIVTDTSSTVEVNQAPSGLVNSVNTVYQLPYVPVSATAVVVTLDGLEQTPTTDYSISGYVLTFVVAPATGQDLKVRYEGVSLSPIVVSVGQYITVGEDTYNRCNLPAICESYLVKHAVYEAKYGDSSNWTPAAVQDMDRNLATLLEAFAKNSDDIDTIPITNPDYLMIW